MRSSRLLLAFAVVGAAVGAFHWNAIEWQIRPPGIRSLPAFQGTHIHDDAAVIGPFGPMLEEMARTWSHELGIDVQVVTLHAGDDAIEPLADRLFRERGVAAHAPTGGMLYVLDASGRRARIEVSYALEGAFPDALVGRVAEDQLAPYASYSSVGMALMDALHQLKDYAFVRVAAGDLTPPGEVRERPAFRRALGQLSGGAGAGVDLARLTAGADLKARIEGPARARYAPSSDPRESAQRYLLLLNDLAGDPSLPLFTPGSQVMRARYPVAPFEYWKRRDTLRASAPFQLTVEGDRAVLASAHPARGFVPILLWRVDGVWRVDYAETWKNLFFGHDGNYVVANTNNPYMFGLGHLPLRGAWAIDPVPLPGGQEPGPVLAALEVALAERETPELHFQIAEILFRNCFASVDALAHYEAAARAAPRHAPFVLTMAERAMYLGMFRHAVPFYEALGPIAYERLGDAHFASADYPEAVRSYERALRAGTGSTRLASRLEQARRLESQASGA